VNNKSLLAALSNRRIFILYRLVAGEDGKTDKVPCDPRSGGNIDSQNPANWLLPDDALEAVDVWTLSGFTFPTLGYGVGLVIHPDTKFFFLDLDSCREGAGWQPHAVAFLARFPRAAREVSVSGTGLHVFGSYAGERPLHRVKNKDYHAELYTGGRFAALGTDGGGDIFADCTAELLSFAEQFFPPRAENEDAQGWTTGPVAAWKGPEDDDELLRRAMRSHGANAAFNGRASFADLWTGNLDALVKSFPSSSGHGAYDGSSADLALVNHLSFWTGSNSERMLRLMMRDDCKLRRDKWARVDNYLVPTILRACVDQTEWYSGPKTQPPPPGPSIFANEPSVPAPPEQPPAITIDAAGTVVPAGTGVPPPPTPTSMLPSTQAPHVLTLDSRNHYESSLPNVIHVLGLQKLALLGFDTFHGQIMISSAVGPLDWHPLKDSDMVRLREALERQNFAAVSAAMMRDSLQVVAERNSYDSAVTWLNGLTWDGVPRIDNFLAAYCGAVDDEYTRAVSRYIWTGLPARVFEPGCQLDMVVAFQSIQGTRKSSGLQALAPAAEYFTDGLDLARDDDNFKRMIQGKIVVEIAELAGIGKAEVEYIKRIITRRVEEWVEKWKTLPTRYLRRCMLFASTNNKRFLPQDETGQRRWLPVEIIALVDELILRDRDQLWAEGAARWRDRKNAGEHGVDWHDAERLAKGRHAAYEQSDPWDNLIESWLDKALEIPGQTLRPAPRTQPLHVADVLEGAIGLEPARIDRKSELRCANVLRGLGYTKRSVRLVAHKHPVERWVAPDFDRA
jgi:hypothetical protein